MNNSRPQSEYRCSQSDLYTVCETIAGTYTDESSAFVNYSSLYTATTGDDLISAVASARSLPDESQRKAEHAVLRKELDKVRVTCLSQWQQLTSYIRDGFSADVYTEMSDAAGHGYYEAGLSGNWDSVRSLMDSATTFVAQAVADLTAGGMPATFEADLTASKDAFAAAHNGFLQSEEAARIGTDKKIIANNKVYKETIRICEDGKRIFRDTASLRQEFTFDRVLDLVRGSQTGHGVSGTTTNQADGMAIGQVNLLLEKQASDGTYSKTAETQSGNDGLYKISGVADGNYRLTASKDGYLKEEKLVVVDDGPAVVDFGLSLY